MNNLVYRITLLCFLLGVMGCDTTEPVYDSDDSDFGLYFLADDTLGTYEAMQQGITELELLTEPWLSEDDISFYDFSSHCIYLKTDKGDFFEFYDEGRFEPILLDKPFVVVAGGTRCYIGSLHSGLLCTAPSGPYMGELDVWYYASDVMHLSRAWGGDEDVRSMDQIRETLSVLNLLHDGLKIRLDTASIIGDSSIGTVQYTFTMTNNDTDDLLVLDADLMGSAQFHYFTNGVTFNYASGHYWADNKEVITPDPFDSWEPEWFTRIGAGDSIQRTVQLAGYPEIPAGTYECSFRFSHPHRIERADRYVSGARYWQGEIASDEIVVVVD